MSAPPTSLPNAQEQISPPSPRLESVDCLRGLVMVLMALDHTRGMISNSLVDATDLSKASAALFLTRWVTHFCAPVFVFLAGTAALLSLSRGKGKARLVKFLWTRGLWLIFLEVTVVRFGWAFNLQYDLIVGQVIWVIGCSMLVLAALVHLPTSAVALFGIAVMALHNLFDDLHAESLGPLAWLWGILHGGYTINVLPGVKFVPVYPLLPWVGVMAAGYGFGVMLTGPAGRQRRLVLLGLGLCVAFILVRATNIYGDPRPWSVQKNALFTMFSFVNCTKYPPSLLFLLMTLGPAMLVLAWWERGLGHRDSGLPSISPTNFPLGPLVHPLIVFGRVPMFFYLVHIPLIHLLAVALAYPRFELALGSFYFTRPPVESGYGHDLWVVYATWLLAVLILFAVCRRFAELKQHRRETWLRYL